MGCSCGGSRRSSGVTPKYKVTTSAGEVKGPFLTQVEARVALTAAGGGKIEPWQG